VIAYQDSGLTRDAVGTQVLTPRGSKGLEFDDVIVVEPVKIDDHAAGR
jgi:DNA helicase IV